MSASPETTRRRDAVSAQSDQFIRALALPVGVLTLVIAIAGALLRVVGPGTPQTFNIGSPIDFVAEAVAASIYAVVGVLLARRLPRHPVPWIFMGIGFAFAVVVLTWAYAVVALSQAPELPLAREGVLLGTAIMQPLGLALLVCLLVVFPDGRPFDHSARRIVLLVPFTAALIAIGVASTPGDIGIFTGLRNPLSVGIAPDVGRAFTIIGAFATVALAAAACRSLFNRYQASDAVQREQIRWFLWAGGLAVVLAGGILVLLAVFPNILSTPASSIVLVLFSIGGAVVPIACAVAIRRYHLYDIDELISRTFVYTSLVALVAGVYAALITALQRVSVELTGEENDMSVVITTLVLAVAFEPAKNRLEALAERFREDPTPIVAVSPVLDDETIEAIATRVADLINRRQSR